MAKRLAAQEEGAAEGCPEWMMTFSDCMTLLLTFFVLLMTFSSTSDKGLYKPDQMSFQEGKSNVSDHKSRQNAIAQRDQSVQPVEVDIGSETPTHVQAVEKLIAGSRANPKDNESCSKRIFLVPSESLFYGDSNVLRTEGTSTLKLIAEYVKCVQARVVISENGPEIPGDSAGLPRSLAIMRFLEQECGLQTDRMCVSICGTAGPAAYASRRKTEIALLERSVYR